MKPPPAKKKKKVVTPTTQDFSFVDRLVYLTGIPTDASEQEVTDMVGAFGKINNVILMPCSEEESEKGQGQKVQLDFMTLTLCRVNGSALCLSFITALFLGVCLHGEGGGCSGSGFLFKSEHQKPGNHSFSGKGELFS